MSALVLKDSKVATMTQQSGRPYGLIEDASIALSRGRIEWVGASHAIPVEFAAYPRQSLGGRLVTPVLIDCHTHLIYGGNRAEEFARRLNGESYAEIAASGGGISGTVSSTRAASDNELFRGALQRLDHMASHGVGVVEVKSGYGLTVDQELRLLRLARKLATARPVKIVTTWLAAHALPVEFAGRQDAYLNEVVIDGLEQAVDEGLVDYVDGFCEAIAFSPAQIARVFDCAQRLNVPIKLHAEQLSDLKGAVMASTYGALSCDHLEYLAPIDANKLAASETVAVLLPGAFYTLQESQVPPVGALRRAGVRIAVATDCNPGSSPMVSLPLAMNMACTFFGLTPEEALAGGTRNAAHALGIQADFGTIEPGKQADFSVWDARDPAEIVYPVGGEPNSYRIQQNSTLPC